MIDLFVSFRPHTCCHASCGVSFALPAALDDELQRTHRAFYCPNGHAQWYSEKSEAEKLRDQLAQKTSQLDQERACCREKTAKLIELDNRLQKTRAGYRGALAKAKKRA